MKTYLFKLIFRFDEDDEDVEEFKITVPNNITAKKIEETLERTHQMLAGNDNACSLCEICGKYGDYCDDCFDGSEYQNDTEELYETIRQNPQALVKYVCQKNKWKYEKFEFDAGLVFLCE